MADPMFMTLRLHDEEDTHMRQTSSRSTASRQAPPKITLLLLGDPRGGSQTTITADTPCTYEAAVNLAFDAFPYALQPFQRSELSFALTRPRPGGGYMSHAPIRRKDDAWMDTMRHIAADHRIEISTRIQ
ncbi:unnamed protein product [Peniophora sp. CBMAI 1063]|nr:unnamed protein product [Peniophora sp. CBMAI 1063]